MEKRRTVRQEAQADVLTGQSAPKKKGASGAASALQAGEAWMCFYIIAQWNRLEVVSKFKLPLLSRL